MGKEIYNPEKMGFVRRTADKIIRAGNVIDLGTVAVGVLLSNFTLAAVGGVSYLLGKLAQKELRRKPA